MQAWRQELEATKVRRTTHRPRSLPATKARKSRPEAALDELLAGNRRFTSGRTSSHRRDLAMLQQMMEKQEPFAAVLSCADSRVPVEVVFDQTIGQLFVTRVAGNIVTAEIIASLEYAAAVLGTNTILVMGHSRCGAVTAAIQATNQGRWFRDRSARSVSRFPVYRGGRGASRPRCGGHYPRQCAASRLPVCGNFPAAGGDDRRGQAVKVAAGYFDHPQRSSDAAGPA